MDTAFRAGDPVILLREMPTNCFLRELPPGMLGTVYGPANDADHSLIAVRFKPFGIYWCAADNLAHSHHPAHGIQ